MKDKLALTHKNQRWDLFELPTSCKPVKCKWVFKIKRDAYREIERYKARLVAKCYTKKEGINYKETYLLVSTKGSF